ncbi:MAG TPA: hypothetical protein VLA88_01805 [Candidatus Saccharimonadales bacterium]|nr:hypothetical protein [Candidatus Saccharimonadales bacterium]
MQMGLSNKMEVSNTMSIQPTAEPSCDREEENRWPTSVVILARIVGTALLAAAFYGIFHLGYVATGHGHHDFKSPLSISNSAATLVVGLLWWRRNWQDVFENYVWDFVFFTALAVIPTAAIMLFF